MEGERWMEIRNDRLKGMSYTELGKKYHIDPRTAKRYAESPQRPEYTLTGPKPTKLEAYKRVERIWREDGLKIPQKQPKRRRLWLNDGSCVRLRAEHANHVWSYDFVEDRLSNGLKIRWLNVIDEYTRECLASLPRRSWKHQNIVELLAGLFLTKGCPEYIRSDNGSELTANMLKKWLSNLGILTAYIEPGSPWENGYCESFNSKMRDEFLNIEIFDTIYQQGCHPLKQDV